MERELLIDLGVTVEQPVIGVSPWHDQKGVTVQLWALDHMIDPYFGKPEWADEVYDALERQGFWYDPDDGFTAIAPDRDLIRQARAIVDARRVPRSLPEPSEGDPA